MNLIRVFAARPIFSIKMQFLNRFNLNSQQNLLKIRPWQRETAASFLFLTAVIFINAWMGDDAFITFRTIQNFWAGHGLTYNITERVQAFTHPLWMMLVSAFYFFTREFFYTTILISIVVSLFGVVLLLRSTASAKLSVLTLWLLAFSKGFVDYSTSGLENPLSHLLVILFFHRFFLLNENQNPKKNLFALFFLAGLLTLNRMDLLLLISPAILLTIHYHSAKKTIMLLLAGFLPFLLWEVFSLFYYGFPFPNTAYAKLNTGISTLPLVKNGLLYLAACMKFDPVLMLTVACVLVMSLFQKDRKVLSAVTGIALHLLYVIKIGGDFMADRFLTASFIAALLCLLRMDISLETALPRRFRRHALSFFLGAIFCVSSLSGYAPVFDLFSAGSSPLLMDRFADEKKFYFAGTGLLPNLMNLGTPDYMSQNFIEPPIQLNPDGKLQVVTLKAVGFRAFEAGPQVHVVDLNALTDPLLSKLPAADKNNWRIGHFTRELPEGYLESVQTQSNRIKDFALRGYYAKLCVITKGKLFSAERFKKIMRMNLKRYDFWLRDAGPR